jgi:DNA polymerase-3 subunit gamma/tau
VRDALSLLDQTIAYVGTERLTAEVAADVLGVADRQLLVALAGAVLDRDAATALRLIGRAVDRGVDLGQLGRAFLGFLRDLEVAASVKPVAGVELGDLVDATPEELDELRGLAQRTAPGLATVLFDRWARALDDATRLPAPRLLYEMAAIDLCAAEPMLPLGDLLQRLDDLESKLRGARPAAPPAAGEPGAPPAPRPKAPTAGPGRSWGTAPAVPAPAPAPPPPAVAPSVAAPVEALSSDEAWRRALATFEKKSMMLGSLMAHADVVSLADGALTLAFGQKTEVDRAEKARAEIEAVVSSVVGRPVKVTVTTAAPSAGAAIRSEVGQESDSAAADRRAREAEARQHPLIRRAQDVFGASLKEIKT